MLPNSLYRHNHNQETAVARHAAHHHTDANANPAQHTTATRTRHYYNARICVLVPASAQAPQ